MLEERLPPIQIDRDQPMHDISLNHKLPRDHDVQHHWMFHEVPSRFYEIGDYNSLKPFQQSLSRQFFSTFTQFSVEVIDLSVIIPGERCSSKVIEKVVDDATKIR